MVSIYSFTTISLLILFTAMIMVLSFLLKDPSQSKLKSSFLLMIDSGLIVVGAQLAQIIFYPSTGIKPILLDYFIQIGLAILPVSFFMLGYSFNHGEKRLRKRYFALLLIEPIITLIIVFTNKYHNLFYKNYSVYIQYAKYGPYFWFNAFYIYFVIGLGMLYILSASVKKSGLISKQSFAIILGTIIPVIVNILSLSGLIVETTTFTTSVCFGIAFIFYLFAIYRFNFLSAMPIGLDLIVNTMNDGYIVLDEDNTIINFNKSVLKFLKLDEKELLHKSIINLEAFDVFTDEELLKYINKCKAGKAQKVEKKYGKRYFSTEFSPIYRDTIYVGTLIFLTDVTQHRKDLETIQNNQSMLIERERLASLGQMTGGIAHSLKTPIFSLSGAIEGLNDLIDEFDESINDEKVTTEDMHDIVKDMKVWTDKMEVQLSYMSELITTVKGQAVTLSGNDKVSFTISELFSHINILMKHELKAKLTELVQENYVDDKFALYGDINSLVQVLNNLISNAIESYKGKPNEKILLKAVMDGGNIIVSVSDTGCGLTKEVQNKLFKEMITTKGKEGTGLGLYMSYSMIKAKFKGDITFTTSKEGTTFNVILPWNVD